MFGKKQKHKGLQSGEQKVKKVEKKPDKEKAAAIEFGLSPTNMKTLYYDVYTLSFNEKLIHFIIAFIIGACVGYLFYGGIGKNEFGEVTKFTLLWNLLFCMITGMISGKLYLPVYRQRIINKRKMKLKYQFRELLDSLSVSIGSGKNIPEAFFSAYEDMVVLFSEDGLIAYELEIIKSGLAHNNNIEDLLIDFGRRSGIEDIQSFGDVFETCYRKGGNIRDIIRSTQRIITDKMEVEMEIETIVAGSKNEQTIMSVMPIVLVGVIKGMSPEFADNFATGAGIASTTVAVVIFVVSYFIGKKVLEIKI